MIVKKIQTENNRYLFEETAFLTPKASKEPKKRRTDWQLVQGYIFWKIPPPPLKILPCFCGFFYRSFKLHKGIFS